MKDNQIEAKNGRVVTCPQCATTAVLRKLIFGFAWYRCPLCNRVEIGRVEWVEDEAESEGAE